MGGGGQNTTTEKSDPWYGQQPYMLRGFAEAEKNLDLGPTDRTALTQRAIDGYAGMTAEQPFTQALGTTQDFAANGYNPSYDADIAAMGRMGAQGGLNGQAMGVLGGLAQAGATDQGALAALRGLGQTGSTDAQGMDLLRRTAAGEFTQAGNPYLQRVVDQNIMAARPSMDAAFASSGRLGSGAQAAAFADAALRQSNELGYQDYANERGYQNAAAGALLAQGNTDANFRAGVQNSILGQGNADAGLRMGAANALGGFSLSDFQNRLGALNASAAGNKAEGDMRLQAAGLLPAYAQAGADSAAQAAKLEAADIARMSPWAGLNNYWDIVGNNVGIGKTGTSPGVDNTGMYVGAGVTAAATIAAAAI